MVELFFYSFVFALICLDKKHAFQFALSQPLIASSLLGFMLGDVLQAMYFGLLVQLLWLGNLPFGASKTPEGNIASIIGTWLYIEYYQMYSVNGQFILLILFVYIIFISYAASKTDTYLRIFNIHLFDNVYESARQNVMPNIGRVIISALVIQGIANWLIILIGMICGRIILAYLHPFLSAELNEVWQFVETAIWAAGIGLVIGVYKELKLKKIIAGIALVTMIVIHVI